MATRDTTSLSNNNPFKVASNAGQALIVLEGIAQRISNASNAIGTEDLLESDKEAFLTLMRNRWNSVLVALDAWRALPGQ